MPEAIGDADFSTSGAIVLNQEASDSLLCSFFLLLFSSSDLEEHIPQQTPLQIADFAVAEHADFEDYRTSRPQRGSYATGGDAQKSDKVAPPALKISVALKKAGLAGKNLVAVENALEEALRQFTPREMEVGRLMVKRGLSLKAIAVLLDLSDDEVRRILFGMQKQIWESLIPVVVSIASKQAATPEDIARLFKEGNSLIAAKSAAATEVERVYARARALCKQLETLSLLAPALSGLSRHHVFRAAYRQAGVYADELLTLARGMEKDRDALLIAHSMKAQTEFFLGNIDSSLSLARGGLAFHDPQKSEYLISLYGVEPKAVCLAYAALASWWGGNPDQSREYAAAGRDLFQVLKSGNPFGEAFNANWLSVLYLESGDRVMSQSHAEEAIEISLKHGFPFYAVWGKIIRGYCIAEAGQRDEGLRDMLEGLEEAERLEVRAGQTYFRALLSKLYRSGDEFKKGLDILDKAIGFAEETEERFYEPELYRLKGELLLAQDEKAASEAEVLFHRAIETSQRQKARSLELRATMSLARLWQRQGKWEEARRSLAKIYGEFSEGFKTKDLREAKELLLALEQRKIVAPLASKARKVVVILLEDNEGKFLVHWRRDNCATNPGRIAIGAGGACRQDESIEEAAKRKLKEETRIDSVEPKLLETLDSTYGDIEWTDYIFYAAVPYEGFEIPNPPKKWKKYQWLTVGEIEALQGQLCPDTVRLFSRFQEDRRSPFLS